MSSDRIWLLKAIWRHRKRILRGDYRIEWRDNSIMCVRGWRSDGVCGSAATS